MNIEEACRVILSNKLAAAIIADQAIGNTNWNVLQRRLAEADTLLTGRD